MDGTAYALSLMILLFQIGYLWLKYQERTQQQEKDKRDMVVKNLKVALSEVTFDTGGFLEYLEEKEERVCLSNPQACYTENI